MRPLSKLCAGRQGAREAQDDMEETDGKNNCHEWNFMTAQKRSTWRSGVKSAMHSASQLPGREPGFVQASMSKIQGLFKDFQKPLQQFSRT